MDSATKPPRRSSTSAAKRDALLAQYRSSGLTQRAFCDQIGLPLSTLQFWLLRARRTAARPAITFAEVSTPVLAPAPTWAVEIPHQSRSKAALGVQGGSRTSSL
jgi:hypothetical protein